VSTAAVHVVDREEQLLALRPEWDRLLRTSDADNLFLTWEWMFTWWRRLGRRGRRRLNRR